MKDILKNPIIYYIITPIFIAVWPVLVFAIYLPKAENKLESNIKDYTEADNIMLDILSLAPERIETGDPNKEVVEFDYGRVVYEIASQCNIHPTKYKLDTQPSSGSKNSKTTQSSLVRFIGIDITSFAKFLSMIQAQWPKLVCESVKLNKKKNVPDEWDINVNFKYYYTSTD